jgi:Flp pilus assembly pilin Flp
MCEIFRAFAANKKGATAIEHGLIAGLIAIIIIAGLR